MWTGLDSDNVALIAVSGLTNRHLTIVEIVDKVSGAHYRVAPNAVEIGLCWKDLESAVLFTR
jgi:hypothetical protein